MRRSIGIAVVVIVVVMIAVSLVHVSQPTPGVDDGWFDQPGIDEGWWDGGSASGKSSKDVVTPPFDYSWDLPPSPDSSRDRQEKK